MTEPNRNVGILQESLAALIAESQSLRTDVHAAEVARRRNAHVNLGVLVVVVIFISMLVAMTAQTNQLARQVRDTNRQVADCTTAGGKCYEEGKKRTGGAIVSILRADVYMAECSRLRPGESGPAFDAFLEDCVNKKLAAAQQATPSPSPAHS